MAAGTRGRRATAPRTDTGALPARPCHQPPPPVPARASLASSRPNGAPKTAPVGARHGRAASTSCEGVCSFDWPECGAASFGAQGLVEQVPSLSPPLYRPTPMLNPLFTPFFALDVRLVCDTIGTYREVNRCQPGTWCTPKRRLRKYMHA